MNRYRGIKYSFRPKSYWNDGNVLQVLLRDVKGAERRKMIKHYYEQGMFQELDETFTKSSLTEDERNRFGVIHPSFMGGEYIPDCNPSETEIARVTLRSTTKDVISIRATREDGELRYSIVDEYDDHEFILWTEFSQKPFSLKELIEFLENSSEDNGYPGGLPLAYNNSNADGVLSRERLRDFTTVSSEIYSQLEEHYDRVYADWIVEEDVVG